MKILEEKVVLIQRYYKDNNYWYEIVDEKYFNENDFPENTLDFDQYISYHKTSQEAEAYAKEYEG